MAITLHWQGHSFQCTQHSQKRVATDMHTQNNGAISSVDKFAKPDRLSQTGTMDRSAEIADKLAASKQHW